MLDKIFNYLKTEIDLILKEQHEFGYRERMQIERGLFLLVKVLSTMKLGYELQGFSKAHKDRILELILRNKDDLYFTQLIVQIFQLKIFLQSLSSENAYVRGDVLSRLGLYRQNVISFIEEEIKRIHVRSRTCLTTMTSSSNDRLPSIKQ